MYVPTEETQNGWLARLGALVMPGRMSRWHQRWLEELGKVAGRENTIGDTPGTGAANRIVFSTRSPRKANYRAFLVGEVTMCASISDSRNLQVFR